MKNPFLLLILTTCLLTYFICGCKKKCKNTLIEDPLITVTSPIEGKTYTGSIDMMFSVASAFGLDSCKVLLQVNSSSSLLYSNNFKMGADVRNKNQFDFSDNQTALPTNLTDVQCIIKAVNVRNISAIKVINVKVKQ
jgi:hypothetical protein